MNQSAAETRPGYHAIIPSLPVASIPAAIPLWQALGFATAFGFGPEGPTEEPRPDSHFARMDAPGKAPLSVFLECGRGTPGGALVHLIVADPSVVDRAAEDLRAAGFALELSPTDQQWGMRELHVRDPDGNLVILGAEHSD